MAPIASLPSDKESSHLSLIHEESVREVEMHSTVLSSATSAR